MVYWTQSEREEASAKAKAMAMPMDKRTLLAKLKFQLAESPAR